MQRIFCLALVLTDLYHLRAGLSTMKFRTFNRIANFLDYCIDFNKFLDSSEANSSRNDGTLKA